MSTSPLRLSPTRPDNTEASSKTPSYQEERNRLISELFISCIAEITCGAALTAISSPFVIPAGLSFFRRFNISILAANVLLKTSATYLECLNLQDDESNPQNIEKKKGIRAISETLQWIVPFNFALLFNATAGVLVHERGHAFAASLVYSNPQPRISIQYLFEGSTTFINRGLSAIGKSLGADKAKLLVVAAGPAAAVSMASMAILSATGIQKSNTTPSKYLYFSSFFALVYHAKYALSALTASRNDLDHDFVQLWRGGIHPIVAAGAMVALPLVTSLLFMKVKKYLYESES